LLLRVWCAFFWGGLVCGRMEIGFLGYVELWSRGGVGRGMSVASAAVFSRGVRGCGGSLLGRGPGYVVGAGCGYGLCVCERVRSGGDCVLVVARLYSVVTVSGAVGDVRSFGEV